jgi:hypothetical protein
MFNACAASLSNGTGELLPKLKYHYVRSMQMIEEYYPK